MGFVSPTEQEMRGREIGKRCQRGKERGKTSGSDSAAAGERRRAQRLSQLQPEDARTDFPSGDSPVTGQTCSAQRSPVKNDQVTLPFSFMCWLLHVVIDHKHLNVVQIVTLFNCLFIQYNLSV